MKRLKVKFVADHIPYRKKDPILFKAGDIGYIDGYCSEGSLSYPTIFVALVKKRIIIGVDPSFLEIIGGEPEFENQV